MMQSMFLKLHQLENVTFGFFSPTADPSVLVPVPGQQLGTRISFCVVFPLVFISFYSQRAEHIEH